MARFVEVTGNKIKTCSNCGDEIAFVKNRHGKWFPVDVQYRDRRPGYLTGIGAYSNMTPWHKCKELIIAETQPAAVEKITMTQEAMDQLRDAWDTIPEVFQNELRERFVISW